MAERFWMIQRGKFRNNLQTATTFLGGSCDPLISGDYMGSAEFECGVLPAAYSRIMSQLGKYGLFCGVLTTFHGEPISLFCRKDRHADVFSAIREYIDNPYQLREWSGLPQHFKEASDFDRHAMETNFWWCIVHDGSPEEARTAGDWMLFVGEKDRQEAFLRVIKADHDGWWLNLEEEERNQRVKNAWRL